MTIDQPNIAATGNQQEQLRQMRSYLYQLAKQLQLALGQMEGQQTVRQTARTTGSTGSGSGGAETIDPNTWNGLKALIIKSGQIVDAFYEEISHRLEGAYVTQSQFGTYSQITEAQIKANSQQIGQYYTSLEQIKGTVDGLDDHIRQVNAYIRTGLLYYQEDGTPVYGLEIGQRNIDEEGTETFDQYAQFVANKLTFFDGSGNDMAWISDKMLHIRNARITASMRVGGLIDEVQGDGSVVTKYGGDG